MLYSKSLPNIEGRKSQNVIFYFSVMKNSSTATPPDLAHVEFFQFIKSNDGKDLYDMFNVVDQPSEGLWNHYLNWWTSNKIDWDLNFNPRGTLDTSWARFVTWTSKAFMKIFMDLLITMTMNPSLMNGEQLLWMTTIMKNFILELKLASKEDATNPKTWFQKMVALRKLVQEIE